MTLSQQLVLKSAQSELCISPSTGKITRLLARGEELLVQPLPHELEPALTADGRCEFRSLDAWGGDECFPTIGGSSLWNLRDHGALWARTPHVFYGRENQCFTSWNLDELKFRRIVTAQSQAGTSQTLGVFHTEVHFPEHFGMHLQNGTLRNGLQLLSCYASHALFAAEPNDWVEWSILPGMTDLDTAAHKADAREVLATQRFADDQMPIASKFYLQTAGPQIFMTSLVRPRLRLRIDVMQDSSLPWVGIWWCHNGWGDGRPHSTVGIEPTNLPSDGPILSFPRQTTSADLQARFSWVISEY